MKKITAAWFDAVDYLEDNYNESITILAKAAGISEDEMRIGLEGFNLFSIEDNKAALQDGNDYKHIYFTLEENAKFLMDLGYIKEIPDFTKFIDTTFIESELNRTKE